MWILVAQRMFFEFIVDVVYFPIWWFTAGARHALLFCVGFIKDANN